MASINLLPQNSLSTHRNENIDEMPSHTYRLDLANKRICGFVNAQEAMKQAISKILMTWIRSCDIYDDNFGFEGHELIGHDEDYLTCLLKYRVRDALMTDTRIDDVLDFRLDKTGSDKLELRFVVRTRFGEFEWSQNIYIDIE